MKLALFLVLLLSVFQVSPQPSDFLSKLRTEDYQNRATLIDHLAHLKTWDTEEEMELNILIDFIKKEVSSDNINYDQIRYKVKEAFGKFKEQWIDDMVVNMMQVIGLDSNDLELKSRIKANPKAYSIDYETYKILTFKGKQH